MDSAQKLPEAFLSRLKIIIPKTLWEEVRQSFQVQKPVFLRKNILSSRHEKNENETSPLDALQNLAEIAPVDGILDAWMTPHQYRSSILSSTAVTLSHFLVQGLSSMIPTEFMKIHPDQENLDLAAAPGGKTVRIANLMKNQGRLAAVEPVKSRFFKLKAMLERCGVTNAKLYLSDGATIGMKCPNRFDRILLDAPCSSEAIFDENNPSSWQHWSLRKVKMCAGKQRRLLDSAIRALRPGGLLMYCTCSTAPEENECVVSDLLSEWKDTMHTLPIELPHISGVHYLQGLPSWESETLHPDVIHTIRICPGFLADSFYMALFTKK